MEATDRSAPGPDRHPDDLPPDTTGRRGIPRGVLWALALAVVVLTIASWVALGAESNRSAAGPDADVARLGLPGQPSAGNGLGPAPDLVGRPAPEGTFRTFDGGQRRVAELQGKPVVINFWASTCPPCVKEMPDLEALHQRYGDRVTFIGIATADRSDEDARAMASKTGVTFGLGLDSPGDVARSFGAIGLPATYVIDATGVVRYQHTGAVPMDELSAALDRLTA